MTVELISYTKPVGKLREDLNTIEYIAYVARVSNPANQHNNTTAEKLLQYMINNKHWSPLQMVDVTLEIETTRDIGRQILRHRSFEFQEFSQRYADVNSLESQLTFREARLKDNKNRQNSISTDDESLQNAWEMMQKIVSERCHETYRWALKNGIAKEQARVVLPEGLTTTRMYMKGSLRSWIHYIQLRSGSGTQKEHMEIARQCAETIAPIFPIINTFVQ